MHTAPIGSILLATALLLGGCANPTPNLAHTAEPNTPPSQIPVTTSFADAGAPAGGIAQLPCRIQHEQDLGFDEHPCSSALGYTPAH